jgi:hypothetical protein
VDASFFATLNVANLYARYVGWKASHMPLSPVLGAKVVFSRHLRLALHCAKQHSSAVAPAVGGRAAGRLTAPNTLPASAPSMQPGHRRAERNCGVWRAEPVLDNASRRVAKAAVSASTTPCPALASAAVGQHTPGPHDPGSSCWVGHLSGALPAAHPSGSPWRVAWSSGHPAEEGVMRTRRSDEDMKV